jgi:hypothetical protein
MFRADEMIHRVALVVALTFLGQQGIELPIPAQETPAGQRDGGLNDPGAIRVHSRSPTKKLIEFGWDEPDTKFMRIHTAEMERTPFDGCVFHVSYVKSDGGQGTITWEGWGERAFAAEELQPALADLQATHFTRMRHNFLRFNTTPAKLDWFDDYSAITNNARLVAWVAQQGGCPGLLFDIEQYDGPLFDFRKQRDSKDKSWELYAAQARQRGREVMQAFQAGFPGLTVFLTFGFSLPWSETHAGTKSLADCHYGLLAPFLDGMVQAAAGGTRLVDGYEISYGYKDPARFASGYRTMQSELLPIVADAEKYARTFSFAFGLWMDHDWRKAGWNTDDLSKNSFSPDVFERSVREALAAADEYVWIYNETPRWWSAEGHAIQLPEPYVESLRRARLPKE